MTFINKIEYQFKSMAFSCRMISQKVRSKFFSLFTLIFKVLLNIKFFKHV